MGRVQRSRHVLRLRQRGRQHEQVLRGRAAGRATRCRATRCHATRYVMMPRDVVLLCGGAACREICAAGACLTEGGGWLRSSVVGCRSSVVVRRSSARSAASGADRRRTRGARVPLVLPRHARHARRRRHRPIPSVDAAAALRVEDAAFRPLCNRCATAHVTVAARRSATSGRRSSSARRRRRSRRRTPRRAYAV